MHTFDIIIGIIALAFLIIGIRRGLISEVFRLLAMTLGFIGAFLYYKELTPHLHNLPLPLNLKNTLSFLIIYIAVAALILITGFLLKKVIHYSLFGWMDRALGGVIGVGKAGIIAYAACLSISSLPAKRIKADFNKSVVYKTYTQLPEDLKLKGLEQLRLGFMRYINDDAVSKIKQTQQKIDNLKYQVDSAKSAEVNDHL